MKFTYKIISRSQLGKTMPTSVLFSEFSSVRFLLPLIRHYFSKPSIAASPSFPSHSSFNKSCPKPNPCRPLSQIPSMKPNAVAAISIESTELGQPASPARPESNVLRRVPVQLIFLLVVGLSVAFVYHAAGPWNLTAPFFGRAKDPFDDLDLEKEEVRLARVLKASAMNDKTVILTTLNAAWASNGTIIDLFLESFRIGNGTRSLLDHLVIVAFDKKAYLRCRAIHLHCFALKTAGIDFSVLENFMTDGYLKMMWRRIDFLRIVLEMGYNFIFTDADIMWFRNPLPQFFRDGDFQIACDFFNGNPDDRNNRPNGGFNFAKSSNRTIEFYKFWYSAREKHPGLHDQDVLNLIKFDPFIDQIGLRMRFLSTVFFGGLCQPSTDFNQVCTMHANCCIGLSRKMIDLRAMLEDWRGYMALPPDLKISKRLSWSVPKNCSLAPLN